MLALNGIGRPCKWEARHMRRNHLFTGIVLAAIGAAIVSTGAVAQTPADAVAARQQLMKDNGAAVFRTIRPFVQNNTGTMADVVRAAEVVVAANGKYQSLWPRGTEQGVAGSKTKPELWQQTDRLNRLIADMETSATALLVAARSGDAAQVRASFGTVATSCNACHDAYQVR